MLRINDILEKVQSYLPPSEVERIEKAYIFSASVHQGQVRLSGEPYLTHPMEVCGILADMKLDAATLVTGLLHDTVEDTLVTQEQIEEAFGKEVAFLVDGLTKISKITLGNQEERQAENFRKMILAMSSDIRILLIRLADRVHNMRTLEFQTPERQVYIAKETLELYAPLANRLGINWMKTELEDLSFRYLDFEAYNDLAKRVVKKKDKRDDYTEEVRSIINREMGLLGIPVEVEGRAKHFYSIYKKMKEQQIDFDEVYDLTAFRIILDSDKEKDCYEALSVVHALWKPVPGRFKDYIAMPKANHYQSLHTTVIGPYGERVEIQIRTRAMHEWAEEGIASHWRYKESGTFSRTDENQIKTGDQESARVHVEPESGTFPGRGLCVYAQWGCEILSKRGDPHRFCIQHPHGYRQQMYRGQGEPKHRAAEISVEEWGYGRDHHTVWTPSQQRLAKICGHLPGVG
jgi:guanosine-3',5'-bis(diphosphate) 3'-pyrophosphohydrolase